MLARLVTDPPVGVPWVLTSWGPDGGEGAVWLGSFAALGYWPLKISAGPYWAMAPSGSDPVTAEDDPPVGSVTCGDHDVLVGSVLDCPHPSTPGGPPNRPTFV
jgi:hypothetical protein